MFKFDAAYAASHRSDLSQSQVQTWVSAANASMTRLVSEGLDEDSAKTAAVKEADKAVPAKTATESFDSIVETLEGVGAKVDPEANVIRGVRVIGLSSRNGRDYTPQALKAAVGLYEGAKVNIDHPEKSAGQPRKVSDRFGVLRSAEFREGSGVYADLHYNPKHLLAPQIVWEAENNPSALGLSHNAGVRYGSKRNGRDQVEAVVKVRSVDIVSDPGTTSGLFEHDESDQVEGILSDKLKVDQVISAACSMLNELQFSGSPLPVSERKNKAIAVAQDLINELSSSPTTEGDDMKIEDLTLEQLRESRPDLIQQATAEKESTSELEQLREENAAFKAEKAAREHRDAVEAELTDAGLDPSNESQVSPAFLKTVLALESADDRAELIADRVALVGTTEQAQKPKTKAKPRTSQVTESRTSDPAEIGGRLATSFRRHR